MTICIETMQFSLISKLCMLDILKSYILKIKPATFLIIKPTVKTTAYDLN